MLLTNYVVLLLQIQWKMMTLLIRLRYVLWMSLESMEYGQR